MTEGCLSIILHAHLPFVRHPEYEEAIEERWLFEAITESYVPLIEMLERLEEDGIRYRLTLSLSPTLLSMLADPLLQRRYQERLERLIELGSKELHRTRSQPSSQALAHFYTQRLMGIRRKVVDRYRGNLVEAFRSLMAAGHVEIITTAATHGYLPLLAVSPPAVRAQIRVGLACFEQFFGRRTKGFWLPECGYCQGVDGILRQHGIRYTVLETHGVTRADPSPRFGVHAPIYCSSGLAVFGRDPTLSRQVWSATEGYPGDPHYREFYRDIAYDLDLDYLGPYLHADGIRLDTGFKYFRITGKTDHKEIYLPEEAERRADLHAAHFIATIEQQLASLCPVMPRKPMVVAPYDAELFGHWWYEGPVWLDRLLRRIGSQKTAIRLITPSDYLDEYPINQVATPAVSSWGLHGFHETWLNGKTDWIYPLLHRGAVVVEELVRSHPEARGLTSRALGQSIRELLLAQASDWAFMIHSGNMAQYATNRTNAHLSHLDRLSRQIRAGRIDPVWLARLEDRQNLFPQIDHSVFS